MQFMRHEYLTLSLMLGMVALSSVSCHGILGGLYDVESKEYGFVETWGNSGTIFLNCDNKKEWIYLDLKNRKFEARTMPAPYGFLSPRTATTGVVHLDVRNLDEWAYLDFDRNRLEVRSAADAAAGEPADWDLAIHHFDFKTNGGKVALTDYSNMSDLVWAFNPDSKQPNEAAGEKVPERKEPAEFVADELGEIVLSGDRKGKSSVNPLLNSWLRKVGSSYLPGTKVYALRLQDHSLAIIKLLGYKNDENVEGILTLQYTLLDENWKLLPSAAQAGEGLPEAPQLEEPENWDFAIHRYDCKTNGGAALQTEHQTFQSLLNGEKPADEAFQPDEPAYLLYDMTYMQQGAVIYVDDSLNPVLKTWLDVDMSSMPPVYTPKKNVYLVKEKDGTCFALQLVKYGSGLITINYIYPVEFK